MRVLALDTTSRDGSVALIAGDRVVEERRGDPSRTHAERLPQDILTLLEAHGMQLSDIDLFAVASGPGSFTGLRIGIATIQGLALVGRRKVVAVSALEALAHAAAIGAVGALGVDARTIVGVWMDAQRREVFTGLYRIVAAPPHIIEVEGPVVRDPGATLSAWEPHLHGRVLFVGDGAVQYGDLVRSAQPDATILESPILAGTIGLVAVSRAAAGQSLEPGAVRPLYVRRPDAEIDRERKALTAVDARDTGKKSA